MARDNRSSKVEMRKRIDIVSFALVQGKERKDIIQIASENEWEISERQVDNYIDKATKELSIYAEDVIKSKKSEMAKSLKVLIQIRNKCMAIQDYARALQSQKEINALLALYEPQTYKHEHSTSDGKPLVLMVTKMDIDEL